ncbi:hypothetical protein CPB84DRAFT_1771826 [Gymnopilus junonius]|uniref:Protoporphyrinogen oxidase n=1 Tax=Gymnopilus junonius TaxID=109634 RepID=A0A9P5NSH8_GYMJU|nr:hypothetical protein CPB84DRAFT_1771826 [Gymnopilus junonius]
MSPSRIAVLGSGLTGLSSAFHLSRKFPKAQIVLLEKEARLGGWVRSERVELPQIGSSVLLEAGPRTLRPNSMAVLELLPGLQRLPSSILSLLSSPLLPTLLAAIIPEPFRKANRRRDSTDESIDSLFSRRFGETFARTFGSALVHGIYATDSRKLSVRAAFPTIWEAEERGRGSIVRGLLMPAKRKKLEEKYSLGNTTSLMRGISVYSFKNGMETLTKALEKSLLSSNNVSIMTNTHLSGLKKSEDRSIEVDLSFSGETLQASHVVSALPLPVLHNLISTHKSLPDLPHLTENPSTTVRVVNLIFPCPPKDVHPEGFGYLISRSPGGYPDTRDSSTPGVLGTVFDSCSLHEQDLPLTKDYYNKSSHTKLTMMTGGPYPQSPLPPYLTSSESQTTPPFIRSLLDQLKVQLGRDIPEPIYWRIWNNEHELKSHLGLSSKPALAQGSETGWDSRLAVIGAGLAESAGRQVGRNWGESIDFNDGLFWILLLILLSG